MGTSGESTNPAAKAPAIPSTRVFRCSARGFSRPQQIARPDAEKHTRNLGEDIEIHTGPGIVLPHEPAVQARPDIGDLRKRTVRTRQEQIDGGMDNQQRSGGRRLKPERQAHQEITHEVGAATCVSTL